MEGGARPESFLVVYLPAGSVRGSYVHLAACFYITWGECGPLWNVSVAPQRTYCSLSAPEVAQKEGGERFLVGYTCLQVEGVEIPKNLYQKQRTSTKTGKNQLQTIFKSFLGRAHRARLFGVEFVENYPYSQ